MAEMTHMTEAMLQLIQRPYLSTYTDHCWNVLGEQVKKSTWPITPTPPSVLRLHSHHPPFSLS